MATLKEWSAGYALQARADLAAWDTLSETDAPACEPLHLLQMACEKVAKASLCRSGVPADTLRGSHAYVAKQLPVILREQLEEENAKPALVREVTRFGKRLAREIELLAPSVDDAGRRPDNCEYPWEDAAGRLWVPAEYTFPVDHLLEDRHGRTVLKLLRRAIERLTE